MEAEKLKRYFVYLLFFALLSFIIIYLFMQLLDNPILKKADQIHSLTDGVADSYVKQAHIVSFDSGFPKFDFTSSYILHYPGEKESSSLKPKLKVFNNSDNTINKKIKSPAWIAIADYAWLSADTTNIRMEDNVVIVQQKSRLNDKAQSFIQLETSIFWIWPKKEYAQTDREVKITTEQALITAVGMNANLQTTQYNFLNDVHVTLKQ
jgi:LPS export ABC transporter protein LptC